MKVLLIDNYDSFTYNLVQLLEQSGCDEVTTVMNNRVYIDASGFDKIIFSPGPGIPSEEAGLMRYLLKNYAPAKSILGICLGHQCIAEFYGGGLMNMDKALHGIKAEVNIIPDSDHLFAGLPGTINGGLYHSWKVNRESFPDCLTITAISGDGIIMGLSHKNYDVKGLQFHPESVMTDYGKAIISNWLSK
jgi:anthranilate synthase component 2